MIGYHKWYCVGCESKQLISKKLKFQFLSYKPPQTIAFEVYYSLSGAILLWVSKLGRGSMYCDGRNLVSMFYLNL